MVYGRHQYSSCSYNSIGYSSPAMLHPCALLSCSSAAARCGLRSTPYVTSPSTRDDHCIYASTKTRFHTTTSRLWY